MTTLVVRNESEALEALRKFVQSGGAGIKIRFKEFVKTIESSATIEETQRSRFFIALQRSVQREHCRYKYGDTGLKQLTDEDRRVTKIAVRASDDGRRIEYDLTSALNARMEAAEQWAAEGPPGLAGTMDLFGDGEKEPTNKWGALTAIGKHAIDKAGGAGVVVIAITSVILGALAYVTPGVVHEGLAYRSAQQQADRDHTYRMELADRTTVVTYAGKSSRLDAPQQRAVEKDIEAKRELAKSLISDNVDQPLLRFVAREAETIQPELLGMAPQWGTLTIDGMPLDAATARQGAKVLRKVLRSRQADGWEPTVTVGGGV